MRKRIFAIEILTVAVNSRKMTEMMGGVANQDEEISVKMLYGKLQLCKLIKTQNGKRRKGKWGLVGGA